MRRILLSLLLLLSNILAADQSIDELLRGLEIAAYWDRKLEERYPSIFNHILSTGYFVTHSALMTEEGVMGIGVAHAPPYLNLNGRIQPFSFLELTANYRIFRRCEDSSIGKYGFGDYADRGANFKVALLMPEQSFYRLPGIAFGVDDFMGSKKFTNFYVVGTKVWPDFGCEASFGWGGGTYRRGPSRGFFCGFNWFPFINGNKWIKGLGAAAEYDPTDYSNDPHPRGRVSHTPINFGGKYNFSNILELSASCIRGDAFAAAGSLHYNWGKATGFIPKIDDPCPYSAPIDRQPLGCYRPPDVMVQNLSYALEDQGFQLTRAWLDNSSCPTLWLRLIVCNYRHEEIVRNRLQQLLAALTPSNIQTVVVQIESYGLPCQQYIYNREFLLRYADHCATPFEMDVLSPREEASPCPPGDLIFHRRYDLWRARISPRMENYFGSVSGKWKYDFGVKLNLEGFLPYNWFYEVQISNTLFSDIRNLSDFDVFFPSQLPNVATDYIRYRQSYALSWDRLYLQKNWNFGRGCFSRVAGGYFQVNYAGAAAEVLWYPAHSYIAIGLEGAVVKKRKYTGLGFQNEIRHFEGTTPIFTPYTTLEQYFLAFYLDFPDLRVFTKMSIGQFLARDKGVRLELTRYFENGIRLSGWITYTDAHDKIHERNYYDRGISVEIPFDLFYKCSSRKIWSYGMAAWLRDAGYSIWTGRALFENINIERR